MTLSLEYTSQEIVLNCTACSFEIITYTVSADEEFCSSQDLDSLHCDLEESPLVDTCKTLLLTLNCTDQQWWNYTQQATVVFTAVINKLSNGTVLSNRENVKCTAQVNILPSTTGKLCTMIRSHQIVHSV